MAFDIKENLKKHFFSFIATDTTSCEESTDFPSTEAQIYFAEGLASKCVEIGLEDVKIDKYCYVTATLKANTDKNTDTIGFISHMDTSPDCSGRGIQVVVTENYDGKAIKRNGPALDPKEFPALKSYKGQTILSSDGTTLLGADDKAGIAEILTAMEYLMANEDIKHGDIRVAFTPDEEVGRGVDFFDVEKFNCDFAYTVDGGELGELSFETFNAAGAKIKIEGKSVHPGSAKDVMINAGVVAMEFNSELPKGQTPRDTEKREGFYHLTGMKGNVENAELSYIIRDFDKKSFEKRKQELLKIKDKLNKKYGSSIVEVTITDQYENMYEILKDREDIAQRAIKAMEKAEVKPIIEPIRGGTDGARLSFMNLPCPNIFTGGHNFHGPFEFIPLESMEKTVEVIVNIARAEE